MTQNTPTRRGRPPATPVEATPELQTPNLPVLAQAVNELAGAEAVIMDSYEVIKQIGRIEAFEFTKHVSDVALAQTFERIKNSKKYKGLPYIDRDGNTKHVSDLEEFCEVFLGRTARRVQQLSQNLNLLGSELYERAEVIGFKSRDYAALKALPEADQEVIKTAMQAEDREQVLDLLQEMAARHQRDKEAAAQIKTQLENTLKAKDQVLASRHQTIDTLQQEIAKRDAITPDAKERQRLEKEAALLSKLRYASEALFGRIAHFSQTIADLQGACESESMRHAVESTVSWLFQNIHEIALQHNLPVDFQRLVHPPWMDTDAGSEPEALG